MNKYTQTQIDDIISYANYCVKEGAMEDEMFEYLNTKNYEAIDKLRGRADAYANDNERWDD